MPAVPGIDDCDHLLVCTNRKGDETFYLRLQEFEWDGKTWYAAALTLDSDAAHFCEDVTNYPMYHTSLKQAAHTVRSEAIERWGPCKYTLCSQTKRLTR